MWLASVDGLNTLPAFPQDPDAEAEALSRLSQIGAMDQSMAKILVAAHCCRGADFLQRKQWKTAGSEFKTAVRKFTSLDKADNENKATRKLRAICEAGPGVAELKTDGFHDHVRNSRLAKVDRPLQASS